MSEEFLKSVQEYLKLDDTDTVLSSISSVMLDPTNSNTPVTIDGITSVAVNGRELGVGGYLDIGLYDTMADLFVNFIGALVFSIIGYFSAKKESMRKFADNFVPRLREDDGSGKEETQK